jgi:predicted Zn-ribbon and HTH transcriptional regulator
MLETRRQRIASELRGGALSAMELSRRVGAPVKTVLADLEHVKRGVSGGEVWAVDPARCLDCGYAFEDRRRVSTPSRCPRCRSEAIQDPRFEIRQE